MDLAAEFNQKTLNVRKELRRKLKLELLRSIMEAVGYRVILLEVLRVREWGGNTELLDSVNCAK